MSDTLDHQAGASWQPAARPVPAGLSIALQAVGWLIVILLVAHHWAYLPWVTHAADFPKHWMGAVRLLRGENPYLGELYLAYPLATGYAHLYLAAFDVKTAERIWQVCGFFLFVGGGALLALGLPRGVRAGAGSPHEVRFQYYLRAYWPLVVALLLASSDSLKRVIIAGNVDIWTFFGCALFVWALARGRDMLAGGALACVILIKVAPVFLVPALVVMGRWRAAATCLGCLAAYAVLILVTGVWKVEMDLYTHVLPDLPHYWQGLSASTHRAAALLFFDHILEDPAKYNRWIMFVNVFFVAAYGAVSLAWWRASSPRNPALFLCFSALLMLNLSPLLEVTHICWILPTAVWMLWEYASDRVGGPWVLAALVAWSLVLSIDVVALMNSSVWDVGIPVIQNAILLLALGSTGAAALFARQHSAAGGGP